MQSTSEIESQFSSTSSYSEKEGSSTIVPDGGRSASSESRGVTRLPPVVGAGTGLGQTPPSTPPSTLPSLIRRQSLFAGNGPTRPSINFLQLNDDLKAAKADFFDKVSQEMSSGTLTASWLQVRYDATVERIIAHHYGDIKVENDSISQKAECGQIFLAWFQSSLNLLIFTLLIVQLSILVDDTAQAPTKSVIAAGIIGLASGIFSVISTIFPYFIEKFISKSQKKESDHSVKSVDLITQLRNEIENASDQFYNETAKFRNTNRSPFTEEINQYVASRDHWDVSQHESICRYRRHIAFKTDISHFKDKISRSENISLAIQAILTTSVFITLVVLAFILSLTDDTKKENSASVITGAISNTLSVINIFVVGAIDSYINNLNRNIEARNSILANDTIRFFSSENERVHKAKTQTLALALALARPTMR